MQADNDLSPYALWDLAELEAGLRKNSNTQVFIELDTAGNDGIYRLEVQEGRSDISQDLEYYKKASLSDFSSDILEHRDEFEKKTQKQKLENLLIWANDNHPTDRTMVVIWGHGEGFSSNRNAQFGGVAIDYNPRSKLSVNDIFEVLRADQILFSRKTDILAMDACLMQTLEVAMEFEGAASYLIGSTQIQNFRGLPYDKILDYMQTDMIIADFESHSGTDYYLSKEIPIIFSSDLAEQDFSDTVKSKKTLSVISLSEMHNHLLPDFNNLIGCSLMFFQFL